jgi:hypothetical protein
MTMKLAELAERLRRVHPLQEDLHRAAAVVATRNPRLAIELLGGNPSPSAIQLAINLILEPRKRGGQLTSLPRLATQLDRVDAIRRQGVTKAEAQRQIAEQDGVTPEAVKQRYIRQNKRFNKRFYGDDTE